MGCHPYDHAVSCSWRLPAMHPPETGYGASRNVPHPDPPTRLPIWQTSFQGQARGRGQTSPAAKQELAAVLRPVAPAPTGWLDGTDRDRQRSGACAYPCGSWLLPDGELPAENRADLWGSRVS